MVRTTREIILFPVVVFNIGLLIIVLTGKEDGEMAEENYVLFCICVIYYKLISLAGIMQSMFDSYVINMLLLKIIWWTVWF